MALLTLADLHEAIDQFGVEVVVYHLNNVADPATVCLFAEQLDCQVDGSAIVQAEIDQRTLPAPDTTPSAPKAPARKWNGSKWIRADKRLAIYLRDGFCCVYCTKNLAKVRAKLRTLDHVLPVALGGTNEADNLVTCCKQCNDRKQDKTAPHYLYLRYGHSVDTLVAAQQRLTTRLALPLNRELAKSILAGTIDLSDCIEEQVK